MARLARVGEPEAALSIHHEIVGTADVMPVDLVVEHFPLARLEVHAVDAPGLVILRVPLVTHIPSPRCLNEKPPLLAT
jgi:hypothetical protein